jgi:subtilisin family serine protease
MSGTERRRRTPVILAAIGVVCLVLSHGGSTVHAAAAQGPKPTIRLLGSAVAGAPATFRLRARAARGVEIVRYRLSFGDGSVVRKGAAPPARIRHLYRTSGNYRVTFTVLDSEGRRGRGRLRLAIGPANQVIGSPQLPWESVFGPPPPPPPGDLPLQLFAGSVELPPGSATPVDLGSWLRITEIEPLATAPEGLSTALEGEQIVVQAAADTDPLSTNLIVDGEGCVEEECGIPLAISIPVVVLPLEAPPEWLEAFTVPSPDRLAEAAPLASGAVLVDELLVTLGTPDEPGSRSDADAVAAAVGAVVSGGLEAIGVYELRWPQPQDLEQRRTELLSLPGVSEVSESTIGLIGADVEPPGDWSDDGPQATWPFDQVRARQAWEETQGSDVTVGIVDEGVVYSDHEDLNVFWVLHGEPHYHATHVAGLACAEANGFGLVGMAWGCPIVTGGIRSTADKSVLAAAIEVASGFGVRVINISLGYNHRGTVGDRCATAAQQQQLVKASQTYKKAFRQILAGPIGRDIVWTLSAGNNCAPGVPSPAGANADLDNVITVAATNSDGSLASFSDFGSGVEVAAPGGVGVGSAGDGTVGLWSTWHSRCGFLGWFHCGGYETSSGTSMAAPVVAGIAALVRSDHPGYGAAAAARCITKTAGEGTGTVTTASSLPADGHVRHVTYSPATLPIVNAEAAVECDTLGPIPDSDYLGNWGPGFEVVEEADGVLGVINEGQTNYENGCVDPPGARIFRNLTREPNDQWTGETIAVHSDCETHVYFRHGAMRIVPGFDGEPVLLIAWNRISNDVPPTIEPDGTVTSPYAFWELRLPRAEGSLASTAKLPASLRRLQPKLTDPGLPASPLALGATLHPATADSQP